MSELSSKYIDFLQNMQEAEKFDCMGKSVSHLVTTDVKENAEKSEGEGEGEGVRVRLETRVKASVKAGMLFTFTLTPSSK